MQRDPYQVLDVSRDCDLEEARAAYRRLAAIFHPDRHVDAKPEVRDEAEKQMRYLNWAWQEVKGRLGDPEPAPTPTSAWPENDDFSARVRHARTRQKAQRRRRKSGP